MSTEKDTGTGQDKKAQPNIADLPEPEATKLEADQVKGGRRAATLAEEGDNG